MPVLPTQIATIQTALQGKKIIDADDYEISKKLTLIYSMIGLRPQHFPTFKEDEILFEYMRMNYAAKTLDELVLAFDKAIQGELEVEDVKVYDQFTCEYLARIMTGYRKWLRDKNEKAAVEAKTKLKDIGFTESITTQEEKLRDIQDWKEKEDLKIDFIPPYLYDYLVEFGELKLTTEEKWEYVAQATEMRKTALYEESVKAIVKNQMPPQIAYNEFLKQFEKKEIKGDEVGRIKELSKKIAVYQFLILNKI